MSNTGQNLRHNPDPGGTTTMDGTLTTPPSVDPTQGVTSVAYTNNDNNADSGTQLYDINTNTDQLLQQAPANAGTVALVGALGVDTGLPTGYDIYSRVDETGRTTGNRGYAVLSTDRRRLYRVGVITGNIRSVGRFPNFLQISDIAIRPAAGPVAG